MYVVRTRALGSPIPERNLDVAAVSVDTAFMSDGPGRAPCKMRTAVPGCRRNVGKASAARLSAEPTSFVACYAIDRRIARAAARRSRLSYGRTATSVFEALQLFFSRRSGAFFKSSAQAIK